MNLTTHARIEAQHELETLSVEMGIARYRASLADGGDTAVSAGQQLMKAALQPMEDALKKWLDETAAGLASRSASLFHFINQLEPVTVAWLTGQGALGQLSTRPPLARLSVSLALQLEGAVNMDAICKANPKLGEKMGKRMAGMSTDRNKALFIRKGAEMVDVKVVQWDDTVRVRVGALLLTMFAESTGLIAIETLVIGGGKTQATVRPTESCRRWLEESHARCELLNPVRLPMVCAPRDWTNPFNGGYLTHRLRQPLVKTRNKTYLASLKAWDMPLVYASVNALQATEWAVNTDTYMVAKALWENNRSEAGVPSRENLPLPARAWAEGTEPDPDALHAWKVEAARTYEANAKLESKRLQAVQKLWVAEMMLERGNRFHYVYNLDWRGRMYPVGPALTPQGDDLAKGLLRFSKSQPLGEEGAYWLAIHGANSYGVDKVSFEERIQWVEANADAVLASANAPTSATFWMEADSPFVFLAFCFEWARLQAHVDAGGDQSTFESCIPVAFDGSCNGLQNFSAMLRDEVGGAATGLVPSHKPADIYSEVARAAQLIIDRDAQGGERQEVAARWVGKMSRKLAKRNTMTVPYGVTRRGMRDQLFAELKDSDPRNRSVDADYLAACNFEAIGNVVVAARRAMDWLREAAKVAASNQLPVRWTTPAGFLAVQDYREDLGDIANFTVLGRRYQLLIQKTGDKLNTRKQSLGISPNFVHSLDAAHLMRTVLFCVEDGMADFAMIHDSYGVHAGLAGRLRDNLREAFVAQYSEPVLQQFRNELAEQLPEELREQLPALPPMGSLDLQQVRKSEYFFA
jgi:DNA-directed RNA polymerase